ncbi:hypothetical protein MMC10_007633 [Thelotrema lepadinum]|nr:hypothetical protein [Thelotrema lepadinum]
MDKYLITGATGQQGGAVARELLKRNATVHALVRDVGSEASKALKGEGVILFEGDFENIAAIEKAASGVTAVFLNPIFNPVDLSAEERGAKNVIKAALKTKTVKTLVVSTSFKTDGHEERAAKDPNYYYPLSIYYASKSAIEKAVREAGFQHYTILRPAWMMYNYTLPTSRFHFPEMESQQTVAGAYLPSSTMPHFDVVDLGKLATTALLEPERFNGHEIELGHEALTLKEVAVVLSETTGVDVKVHYRDEKEAEAMKDKVPTQPFHAMANDMEMKGNGEVLSQYGIPLTSFREYCERNKDALRKALGQS